MRLNETKLLHVMFFCIGLTTGSFIARHTTLASCHVQATQEGARGFVADPETGAVRFSYAPKE